VKFKDGATSKLVMTYRLVSLEAFIQDNFINNYFQFQNLIFDV